MTSNVWTPALRSQIVKYVDVASLTLLVFDYAINFEREVMLVWMSKLGFTTTLFFLSRYTPFLTMVLVIYSRSGAQIASTECHNINNIAAGLTALGVACSEGVLVMRTYAIWVRRRKMLYVLGALSTVVLIAWIALTIIFQKSVQYGSPPSPSILGCYPIQRHNLALIADIIVLMLFETIIISLTLCHGLKNFQTSDNPLVVVLYRNGILYLLYTCLVSAANIAVIIALPADFIDPLIFLQLVMHSILSGRVVLQLREIHKNYGLDKPCPIAEFVNDHWLCRNPSQECHVT